VIVYPVFIRKELTELSTEKIKEWFLKLNFVKSTNIDESS